MADLPLHAAIQGVDLEWLGQTVSRAGAGLCIVEAVSERDRSPLDELDRLVREKHRQLQTIL